MPAGASGTRAKPRVSRNNFILSSAKQVQASPDARTCLTEVGFLRRLRFAQNASIHIDAHRLTDDLEFELDSSKR